MRKTKINPRELSLGNWVQIKPEIYDLVNHIGIYSTREFRIEGFNDSTTEDSTLICHYTIPVNDGFGNGKIHSGVNDIHIEGIQLTDDWLVKAGFHYEEKCKYWIDGTWELVFKKDGNLWWVMSHSEYDGSTWFLKKIKYVHEFQNIYYQINGFDPYDKDE